MDKLPPEHRKQPRVVIIGAGFAGLWAARTLAHSPFEVFILDRNNYHTFLPLLYQVAAAEVAPEDIIYPVRAILRRYPHEHFWLGGVERIDLKAKTVLINGRDLPFDYLIIATGSIPHFYAVPGAVEHAYLLKNLEQGILLRNRILASFEQAVHEQDPELRRQLLTCVIIGGGPTGVEFAGALAELVRGPLRKDFRGLDFREIRTILIEAQQSLLPGMGESLSVYAEQRLRSMGVDVRLKTTVREIAPSAVHLQQGEIIPSDCVVWTAGVRGDPLAESWGLPTGRDGRVAVLPTLQVPGHPEVYVAGDLARVDDAGTPLPMIAPAAIQEGKAAARNIARQQKGLAPLPFVYRDPGSMATIGRNKAIARLGHRTITGFPAWIIWLTVHIIKLIGFRNRLVVSINWAWDYFFFERTVRVIVPQDRSLEGRKTPSIDTPRLMPITNLSTRHEVS